MKIEVTKDNISSELQDALKGIDGKYLGKNEYGGISIYQNTFEDRDLTVGELKKYLNNFKDTQTVYAYEGEPGSVIIVNSTEHNEYGSYDNVSFINCHRDEIQYF